MTTLNHEEQHYQKVVDLWQKMCELHNELFNITCDEYLALLSSDIESLEKILIQKDDVIGQIKVIEDKRSKLIQLINNSIEGSPIQTASDLIALMHRYHLEGHYHYLKKFNSLLIDIIEKIKEQNKKNQIFLNKAITSLRDIKNNISGQKSYETYNSKGAKGFK